MRRVFFVAFFSFMFTLFGLMGCVADGDTIHPSVAETVVIEDDPLTLSEVVDEIKIVIDEDYIQTIVGDIEDVPNPPFFLTLGGVDIHMGVNINEIKNALGGPIAEFQTPSCAFDGTDIVFRFPGVQVHTIPIGDSNFVHTIAIMDDTVSTSEGIMLGSSLEDLIDLYGSNYVREFGMYTFTRAHTSISFYVRDGMVISIIYELDVYLYFEVG